MLTVSVVWRGVTLVSHWYTMVSPAISCYLSPLPGPQWVIKWEQSISPVSGWYWQWHTFSVGGGLAGRTANWWNEIVSVCVQIFNEVITCNYHLSEHKWINFSAQSASDHKNALTCKLVCSGAGIMLSCCYKARVRRTRVWQPPADNNSVICQIYTPRLIDDFRNYFIKCDPPPSEQAETIVFFFLI